jgi:GntR family transcriptional regulator
MMPCPLSLKYDLVDEMPKLKNTNSTPLSIKRPSHATLTDQTVLAIQEAIKQGRFTAGSQLPSEMELLQMLGVSRTTLREALRILGEQRLIRKKRGRGTFVMERAIIKDLSRNFGITEMISQAGYTPGMRDVEIKLDKASKTLAEKFEIPEGSALVVIERVRTADQIPVVWTRDIMPEQYLDGWMPTLTSLNQNSLYECLERYANLRIVTGTASFSAVQAGREIAEKLEIQRNTLLLLIDQMDNDQHQRSVLYSTEYHLTDKFNFIVHRKGPAF